MAFNRDAVGTLALVDRDASTVVAHAVLQKLEPGATQVAEQQATMFDNCMALSPSLRVRWASDNSVTPPPPPFLSDNSVPGHATDQNMCFVRVL